MLDADAALVKHSVDILGGIAAQMAQRNLDVFLTSDACLAFLMISQSKMCKEYSLPSDRYKNAPPNLNEWFDWLLNGERRINGGFLMTRNSEWSEHLFKEMPA
eukprot:g29349.t1